MKQKILISTVSALLIVLFIGVFYKQPWTGFANKVLWDWMELLIVPLVLSVGAFLFKQSESKLQSELAEQRAERERQLEEDRYCESALDTYLDRMTELLLEKKLRDSKQDWEVRDVARTRTLTTVRRLDGKRKGIVMQFLYWSRLLEYKSMPQDKALILEGSIVNLVHADFSGVNLSYCNLEGICLCNVKMNKATLTYAFMNSANFAGAVLDDADLAGATMSDVILRGAHLQRAYLGEACLVGSDLIVASLNSANLSKADLRKARLCQADLRCANLTGANLEGADLTGANLKDAKLDNANLSACRVTEEQLEVVASSKDTILPNLRE